MKTSIDVLGWFEQRDPTIADVERVYIIQVVEACRGNMSKAARILGIDRRTLYRKMTEYRVKPSDLRQDARDNDIDGASVMAEAVDDAESHEYCDAKCPHSPAHADARLTRDNG